MEKILKLRTYVDGSDNDALFPSAEEPAEITSFTYNAKRMGDAPSITFTLNHTLCLDNLWNDKVYCWFNGEKYFLKQVPSSSYDNTESRYKHSAEMVSERMELNNVYFFDVVAKKTEYDKPSSNSTNVVFHGDIHEFASRLNYSLTYSHLDYRVVVDDGVESEDKQLSFDKQFFFSVLQEVYNTYNIPFYFVGKEIHIGHYESELDEVFEYGVDKSLLSVAKNNTNNRIINRSSGFGSSENIPYYYPNKTPYGDIAILYNGSVTDDVNITDWARFASCGLNGSLKYVEQHIDKPIEIIGNIEDFANSSIEKKPFLGSYAYVWEGRFDFRAEGTFNKLYTMWTSPIVSFSGWRIVDENGITMQNGTATPIAGIPLDYGDYSLYLSFNVGYRSNKEEVIKYVKENVTVDVKLEQLSCSRIGWVLDEKRNVSLGALGIVQTSTPNIGDTISFKQTAARVPIMSNLMPSIYRSTNGEKRFYNALNKTYINPDDGTYYYFSNPFVEGKRREHIEQFDDIKPTIVGIKNKGNEFIDEIIDVTFDDDDNDEKDESGKYLHPYFYVKLRKFDGVNGFNLFAQAIESGDMTISMTSGVCSACNWKIGVDEDTLLNPVQVYEDGSLKRDANGNVIRKGVAQERQNDTRTNEVWVALMKDDSTFGVLMPNALNNYRPKKGDKFVILNIQLPQAYIEAAEKRLEEAIIKHMYENNDSKFNFSIKFSRIYFAENDVVLKALNENVLLKIRYNGQVIPLHVSSFSYKMQNNEALPEITVELSDTLTIHRSVAQQVASAIKSGVSAGLSNLNVPELGHPYFVSKVADDIVGGRKEFTDEVVIDKTLASPDFERNATLGTGWGVYKDANGDSVLEADILIGRKRLEINELLVNQVKFQKGTSVVSNAGCSVESVEEHENFYRCFFNTEQDTQGSGFAVGDQARCQRYDATYTDVTKYYWRLVVGVAVGYVDLSKSDKDGNGVPEIGDTLVQLGNREDVDRQNAILISSYPEPSIIQYSGINSYSLDDKIVTKISPNDNKFTGKMVIEAGTSGLENINEWEEKQRQIDGALEAAENAVSASKDYVDKVVANLQDQLDGKVESFFYDEDPTLSNLPAKEWTTDELKEAHLNDTYTNTISGHSWRWLLKDGIYQWVEIADTQAAEALAKAKEALGIANSKVAVFTTPDVPQTPYNEGDFWLTDGRIKRSSITRITTGERYSNDWVFAEDSHEYIDSQINQYKQEVAETVSGLNKAIEDVLTDSKTYTDEAKQAVEAAVDKMLDAKANVEDVYTKSLADGKISAAESAAIAKAEEFAKDAQSYAEATAKAYADGEINKSEKETLKKYEEALAKAKEALEKAKQNESQISAVEDDLKSQIDGKVESYFEEEDNVRFDISAKWNDIEFESHDGDTFTNIKTGQSWKWKKDDGTYQWVQITDTATEQALTDASKAQATADGKRTTYYQDERPTPPYQEGDMWSRGITGQLMICTVTKAENESPKDSDWAPADDSHEYTDESIGNIQVGGNNLLRNSGFNGDYLSKQLEGNSSLNGDSQMFSPSLVHWESNEVVARESSKSESGAEVIFNNEGFLSQTLINNIIVGDSYVISFKGQGVSVTISCGGVSVGITLSGEYKRYTHKFVAQSNDKTITFESNNAILCEVQLERGTIASTWGDSMWDNTSALARYQELEYLRSAMKEGKTEMNGGLILSRMIALFTDKELTTMTAGVNGSYVSPDTPAFWAGGSLSQAIDTVARFRNNPSSITEDEWSSLAKFVATHGGDVFMRGYIHALGGLFQGAVDIAGGKIKLNADGSGSLADGGYSWDSSGVATKTYPDAIRWVKFLDIADENNQISLNKGGYIKEVWSGSYQSTKIFNLPSNVNDGFSICLKAIEGGTRYNYPAIIQSETPFRYIGIQGIEGGGSTIQYATGTKMYIETYVPYRPYQIMLRFNGDYWDVETDGKVSNSETTTGDIRIWS